MNYIESTQYLQDISKGGSKYGLDTINNFLSRLNRPDDSLKFVHIAGTNGKGSTSSYITNILMASGYKVGTFNSPAVISLNEMMLINENNIDDESFAKYITIVRNERDKMISESIQDLPTVFELEFTAALLYFKDQNCDIVILECGMGGLTDATNAIHDKLVSVITSISLEHTEYLGNTLTEIATQKFGIVKDYLVTNPQSPEIMAILNNAKHLKLTKEPKLQISSLSSQTFTYGVNQYKIQMLGIHQLYNATLAIETAKLLKKFGYNITKEDVKKGLFNTKLPGRFEKIPYKDKVIILDGAHNPNGVKSLKDTIDLHLQKESKAFVFSVFKDKDIETMLQIMKYPEVPMYIASAPTSRGLDIDSLKTICEKYHNSVITNTSVTKAVKSALNSDAKYIIIFGTLSIQQEVKKYLEE